MSAALTHYLNTFSQWVTNCYKDEPNLLHFLNEINKAFHFTVSQFEVAVIATPVNGVLVHRKPNSETAQFGFMFLSGNEEQDQDQELWLKVLNYCKTNGIAKLVGPIQGATYFPYRFLAETDGSPLFKGEYFSQVYDHQFLLKQAPNKVLYFKSGYRTRYQKIIEVSAPYYHKLIEEGLTFKKHVKISAQLFKQVFELVIKIFGANWNFQKLSETQFQAIYNEEVENKARLKLHTLYFNQELIGFIRYVEDEESTLICKTMGILPEYQKLGIGNAAVAKMHWDAKAAGYSKMIYALVYDGNRVKDMPQDDAVIFRKYASYEFLL